MSFPEEKTCEEAAMYNVGEAKAEPAHDLRRHDEALSTRALLHPVALFRERLTTHESWRKLRMFAFLHEQQPVGEHREDILI